MLHLRKQFPALFGKLRRLGKRGKLRTQISGRIPDQNGDAGNYRIPPAATSAIQARAIEGQRAAAVEAAPHPVKGYLFGNAHLRRNLSDSDILYQAVRLCN